MAGFLVGLALGGAVICLGLSVAVSFRRRLPDWRRLEDLASENGAHTHSQAKNALRDVLFGLLNRLAAAARPQKPWEMSRLRRELLLAGFQAPSAVNVYLGVKVACCLVVPLILFLSPLPQRLQGSLLVLALVGAAGVGFILPSFFLEARTKRRRERLTRELPEVLDLLVITVEAGLGLDAAIKRVAREVTISAPTLASELTMVSLELKAGFPREKALKNLADRCGVEELNGLVNMLNQADRFGVSVGRSLRVHSDTVRTKWRQAMEEKAAKVPLKLLFPILFMVFPAIIVVMAGPAIIRVSETMLK